MKLTFDLKQDTLKVKFIPPDRPYLTYLIDTGADTPVWCKGEEEFIDIFPDGEKQDSKFILSGFGKEAEIVDVYRISEFKLTDEKDVIFYKNFILAVTNRPQMNVDLILPSSIFDHMVMTVDRLHSVTYPRLTLESEIKVFPVFFRHIRLTEQQKGMLGIDSDIIVKDVYAENEV